MSWVIIKEWNLPYTDYLNLIHQKKKELLTEKDKRYLIICSHPHCFTHGRGLRNLKNGPSLIHLNQDQEKNLPLPLHHINRGGGLTFHYPGQIIIYPIVNLNVFPKALMTLMHLLLLTTGDVLKEINLIHDYNISKEIYGLWTENKKVASIGMGLDHYVTEHGLALNFFHDEYMFALLNQLYPCGISPQTYSNIQSFHPQLEQIDRETFVTFFTKKFFGKFLS